MYSFAGVADGGGIGVGVDVGGIGVGVDVGGIGVGVDVGGIGVGVGVGGIGVGVDVGIGVYVGDDVTAVFWAHPIIIVVTTSNRTINRIIISG